MKNLKLITVNPHPITLAHPYNDTSSHPLSPLLLLVAFCSSHLPVSALEMGSYHREREAFLANFRDRRSSSHGSQLAIERQSGRQY